MQKANRIERHRKSVQQYQDFLEMVRLNNSDQYGSIASIIDRHKTLQKLQKHLKTELLKKENELSTKRFELVKYESDMNT